MSTSEHFLGTMDRTTLGLIGLSLAVGCSGDGTGAGSGGMGEPGDPSVGQFVGSGGVPSGQSSSGSAPGTATGDGGDASTGGADAGSGGTSGSSTGGASTGGVSTGGGASAGDVPDIPACAGVADWPAHLVQLEEALFQRVNQARANGQDCGGKQYDPMPALEWDPLLRCSARLHAQDMVERGYYSHGRWTQTSDSCDSNSDCSGTDMKCNTVWFHDANSPSRRTDGEKKCSLSPTGRLKELGGSGAVGENNNLSTTATADHLMSLWLGSSGHCNNLMSKSYSKTGLAVVDGGIFEYAGTVTVAQEFK